MCNHYRIAGRDENLIVSALSPCLKVIRLSRLKGPLHFLYFKRLLYCLCLKILLCSIYNSYIFSLTKHNTFHKSSAIDSVLCES